MLLNLSHHPHTSWSAAQLDAALTAYGSVADIPFPQVPPGASVQDIAAMADELVQTILSIVDAAELVVHIMGEMTLVYSLVARFQDLGIPCVASTTERVVEQVTETERKVVFVFVKFREYEWIK